MAPATVPSTGGEHHGGARKQPVPPSAGTFPTGSKLFFGLLLGVVILVVGLTYFPVLALGPIVEHLVGHFYL